MAPEEERLLLEIEKLTKRPLERAALDGFRPHERPRRERDARPPDRSAGRRERDDTVGAGQQAGPRAARYATRARGHHEAVDEFFLKPYEPSTEPTAEATPPEPTQTPSIRPTRKVAALLGGSKKSG